MIRTTNSKIVKAIAGTIVEMHPYHNPENMDKIINNVVTTLDNCIRNIKLKIMNISKRTDCFLCKYAEYYGSSNPSKDNEVCKLCCNNPNYKNNQEFHPMARKPHNEWTDEEKEKYSF